MAYAYALGGQSTVNSEVSITSSYEVAKKVTGGVITMEDILLKVILDDGEDQIINVQVTSDQGEMVYQAGGCGSSNCSYNLDQLSSGMYDVIVMTELGSSFDGSIELP